MKIDWNLDKRVENVEPGVEKEKQTTRLPSLFPDICIYIYCTLSKDSALFEVKQLPCWNIDFQKAVSLGVTL